MSFDFSLAKMTPIRRRPTAILENVNSGDKQQKRHGLRVKTEIMSQDDFQVERMDNVTMFVPDRYEAAEWLERVLGLEIRSEYEQWAENEDGPLMVSSDGKDTMIAICREQSEESRETDVDHHISFRVPGAGFLRFLDRLQELSLTHADGQEVTRDDIIDFELSYGIHFHDPYGNQFELTTYDYQTVTTALE